MIQFLVQYIKKTLNIRPEKQDFKSILVIRNDHIGDLVLCLPVLHAIRRSWPKAKISILVSEYAADIVRNSSDVDKFLIQKKSDPVATTAEKINREKVDAVFNFNATRENAKLVRHIKARIKIGYAYKPYNMISHNRFVFTHRSHPPIHETVFMLEFLKTAGINIKFNNSPLPLMFLMGPDKSAHISAVLTIGLLPVNPVARKRVNTYLKQKKSGKKKIIAIHCGDNKSADNWSCEKYIRFAGNAAKKFKGKHDLFLILGPSEKQHIETARNVSSETGFRLIEADLSLKELVAFIARTEILVAGSTGPLHIAGALNKKVIGLYPSHKSQSKEKWGPLTSHAIILEAEEGKTVEESIQERQVFDMIKKMI